MNIKKIFVLLFFTLTLTSWATENAFSKEPSSNTDDIINQTKEQLEQFKKRKKYDGFSITDLKSIPDDQIERAIIDYLNDHIIVNDHEHEYEKIKKLSNAFQYVYATWMLENDVYQGGFNQYFHNSASQYAKEAYNGYIAFGLPEVGNIVNAATQTLPDSDRENNLHKRDKEFYKYYTIIDSTRIKYIKKNLNEFVTKK